MAVTIDDKLKMFQSLLMENINAENEQVITKLSKEYDQELASSQNKINQQADRILRDAEITSKTESNNQIQKSVSERNKQVLFARKQYTEELFSLLREKVTNMPKEKTVHYLKRSLTEIERMFDQNHILLKVEAKDIPVAKELLEQMKQDGTLKKDYELQSANLGGLGGIVGEDPSSTLRADFSISSYLEDQKEWIGRRIQNKLSEVMGIELE
ncbi:MAG: V-type ATP synthase subunit E [Anaerofustis sp.]